MSSFHGRRFARHPGVRIAIRELDFVDGCFHCIVTGRIAVNPDSGVVRLCLNRLFLDHTGHVNDGKCAGTGRTLFQSVGNGRQRGIITNRQIPVECVGAAGELRGPVISIN